MTYKVIALSVGGRRNKIFKSGDEVTADDFPPGTCPDLVAKGFLEEVKRPEVAFAKPVVEKNGPPAVEPVVKKKTTTRRRRKTTEKK